MPGSWQERQLASSAGTTTRTNTAVILWRHLAFEMLENFYAGRQAGGASLP